MQEQKFQAPKHIPLLTSTVSAIAMPLQGAAPPARRGVKNSPPLLGPLNLGSPYPALQPVHRPELGVNLGLDYCHSLLISTGPTWV